MFAKTPIKLKLTPTAIKVDQIVIKLSILDKLYIAYTTDDSIMAIPAQSIIFTTIDIV